MPASASQSSETLQSKNVHIANAQQAALLTDPTLILPLHALIRGSLSVSEVAQIQGVSVRQAYALVQKLLEADVVRQVGQRPHRGRPIKLYRALQPWFIPFEVTGAATLGEFLWLQFQPHQRQMFNALAEEMLKTRSDWGQWLKQGPKGVSTEFGNLTPPDSAHFSRNDLSEQTSTLLTLREMRLSQTDLVKLKGQIMNLLREFDERSRQQPESRTYAFSLTLTPGNWWETEK